MSGQAALLHTSEGQRLLAVRSGAGWRRWGPYVSDRQWGTVREDYSPGGNAWDYLPHDHARSQAYRWGEDGLAGFADEHLRWCLGLALWNGQDPILKERLFGLTNGQGNHGEDVKEHYCYLDATPTHSYMRMLYKYPQAAFPYAQLVAENARRGTLDREFELHDAGMFDNGRYFDVTVEYAKASPDDLLMRITVENRADVAATIHVLPQLWARNTWSWSPEHERARISLLSGSRLLAQKDGMAEMRLTCDVDTPILFCENETNVRRLFGMDGAGPFKDGINDAVVTGDMSAVRQDVGSKAAFHRQIELPPHGSTCIRLRFCPAELDTAGFADFDDIVARRHADADDFYNILQEGLTPDLRLVQRQALAGMLWSKQFYHYDVGRSFEGDPLQPKPPEGRARNQDWKHLNNADIVSMPDKWEYPWYASWDLAFQCTTLALVDTDFAKDQLLLLTRDWYQHPNGQLPAYEWAFSDANPPVHAWAALRVYAADRAMHGMADTDFLERIFQKLLLNFAWWVNRKDAGGRNIFQGGFLGLDNVAVFDRSAPLPGGGTMDQADGTAWMATYALNMMQIAVELAFTKPIYEDMASKFLEHFLSIAQAMTDMGGKGVGLWDDTDGFFYDVLSLSGNCHLPVRLRSVVGLIPMFAVEVLSPDVFRRLPSFAARARWFLAHRPKMAALVSRWTEPGKGSRNLLSLLRGHRLKCLLARALDPSEFLSDYGIRSLSRTYKDRDFLLHVDGRDFRISYEPGEAERPLFGGNSNWRGPIWFPINVLLIEALLTFHSYYGDDFRVDFPAGSGQTASLKEVAHELSRRLIALFLPGADGRRPFWGDATLLATDPAFRDNLMFPEHFDGETGRGLGAMHQTGWTGLVANLIALEAKVGVDMQRPLRKGPRGAI
jgi:hypothetical protein